MNRIIRVNRVDKWRCVICGSWFPVGPYADCDECRRPKPVEPEPVQTVSEPSITDRFRELNVGYIQSLHENSRNKRMVAHQRRKSREAGVVASFTADDWAHCREHFNNRCAYCGKVAPLSQDHVLAVSKGGNLSADNVVPACKSCNSSKLDRDFLTWYRRYSHYSADRERDIIEYLERQRASSC